MFSGKRQAVRWFTTEELDTHKQKQLGLIIVDGLCFSLLSGIGIYALEAGRLVFTGDAAHPTFLQSQTLLTRIMVGISMLGIATGFCITFGGLLYGIMEDKKKNLGIPRSLKKARIIARYAIDSNGNFVSNELQFESHKDLRYFVRMNTPGEGSLAYECAKVVFFNCGEGSVGDADIQGQWLRGYSQYRDIVESPTSQSYWTS
jgi:uncharacterized protein YneR